jgi:hypothetical protein
MSTHVLRSLSRPWSLIAAALVIHVGGALAAQPTRDAQQQARETLAGRTATHPAPITQLRAAGAARPRADTQELARQLVLGRSDARREGAPTETAPKNAAASYGSILVQGDAQTMAQRTVLGQRRAGPENKRARLPTLARRP